MKVAVLGASGFIGRRIVSRLAAMPEVRRIVAVARGPATFAEPVEVRLADARDEAAVDRAVAGATHLINCVMGGAGDTALSAATAFAVAGKRGVARTVHLSSVAVYGRPSGLVREDAPPGLGVDAYGRAKLKAERHAWAHMAAGVPGVVLRPALVFGPGSSLWVARIARLLASGQLGDLGVRGRAPCNLVHVDDVARAAIGALRCDAAAGRAFNLSAPDPPSWNAYFADLGEALDIELGPISPARLRAERLLAYPRRALRIGRRIGLAMPEPLAPGLAALFDRHVIYDSTAAAVLLPDGWTDYRRGVAESAAWLRSRRIA